MQVPKKVIDRFTQRLKHFQTVLKSAQDRDVNESDTATIVIDLLAELFGYDKYSEITKEQAVKQNYCDLAIRLNGKMTLLLEVKAIGLTLKETHVAQAISYCANCGTEWVILTNGVIWRFYRVIFGQPIDQELVFEINLLEVSTKNFANLDQLFLISKEGHSKTAVADYYAQKQAASRFNVAALLISEPLLKALKKELKGLSPDIRIELADLNHVLTTEVLKRDCIEGEKADESRKVVSRYLRKQERLRAGKTAATGGRASVNSDDNDIDEALEHANAALAAIPKTQGV